MGNAPHKLLNIKEADMPLDISVKGLQFKSPTKKEEDLTGWERVKKIFQLDMFGEITPQLQRCKDTVFLSLLVGAAFGGIGRSRIAYMNFFRSNAHTAFESPRRARAKLQETVLLGFGSGAYRIGWRVMVFSTIYSVSSTSLSEYRGNASFLDPGFGGAAAGFLYKFLEGPKASIAGGVVGGILGLMAGAITSAAMALVGLSPDAIIAYDHQQILEKRRKELESLQALRPPETARITLDEFHSKVLSNPEEISSQINSANTVSDIQPTQQKLPS